MNPYFVKIIAVSSKSMMNTQRKLLLEFLPSMVAKMKKKYIKVLEVSPTSKEMLLNTATPYKLFPMSSVRNYLKTNIKSSRKI